MQFCSPLFVINRNPKLTTCPKLTIETLEQGGKYIESQQ